MGLERELRQVITELDLVSQVSAVSLDASTGRDTSDDIGGKRPPGGIDHQGDRAPDFVMKSADHFRRRAAKAFSEVAVQAVLNDARSALASWKRQPMPTEDPNYGSPLWKHWVASSELSDAVIAHRYGVSRQYVNRIRNLYAAAV